MGRLNATERRSRASVGRLVPAFGRLRRRLQLALEFELLLLATPQGVAELAGALAALDLQELLLRPERAALGQRDAEARELRVAEAQRIGERELDGLHVAVGRGGQGVDLLAHLLGLRDERRQL